MKRFWPLLVAVLINWWSGATVWAQSSYPNRPVNLVVPYPAGNAADIIARIVASRLQTDLGQPFVVINRPGAAGTIGTASVAHAAPDGYTLLVTSPSNITIAPWLGRNLDYDPQRDFVAVTGIGRGPFALLVNNDIPVKSTAELVDYVRKRPGALNYGSFGPGSLSHLAMELLRQTLKIDLQHVPYQGSGSAQSDLIAGRVQLLFDSLTAASGRLGGGDAKVLALSTNTRHPMAPNVPTIAESGIPELATYDVAGWVGILAPSGTPPEIVNSLSSSVSKAMDTLGPTIVDRGMERFSLGPRPFDAYLAQESAKWRETIQRTTVDWRK